MRNVIIEQSSDCNHFLYLGKVRLHLFQQIRSALVCAICSPTAALVCAICSPTPVRANTRIVHVLQPITESHLRESQAIKNLHQVPRPFRFADRLKKRPWVDARINLCFKSNQGKGRQMDKLSLSLSLIPLILRTTCSSSSNSSSSSMTLWNQSAGINNIMINVN